MIEDSQHRAYNLGRQLALVDIYGGRPFRLPDVTEVMMELKDANLPDDRNHRHQFKFGYAFQYNTEKEG